MKRIILFAVIFILSTGVVFCQESEKKIEIKMEKKNPDGDCVSIHVTPLITSITYNANDKSNYETGPQLNFDFRLKLPWTKNITTTLYHESINMKYRDQISIQKDIQFKQTTWGVTLSYYFQ